MKTTYDISRLRTVPSDSWSNVWQMKQTSDNVPRVARNRSSVFSSQSHLSWSFLIRFFLNRIIKTGDQERCAMKKEDGRKDTQIKLWKKIAVLVFLLFSIILFACHVFVTILSFFPPPLRLLFFCQQDFFHALLFDLE
jgi:hypothetical protein